MSVAITPEDVTDGYQTAVPASEIQLYIAIVDQSDACLDDNNVPDDTQRALKLLGVRHLLTLQANGGRGNITSESAPSGASRSYSAYKGIWGTRYREMLNTLDRYGCVSSIVDDGSHRLDIRSVGGGACRR